MPALPLAAHALTSAFLELVDARLPSRIEGLYLTGSIALGDFCPGVSDVDFVAVTAEPLSDRALDVLDHTHAELRASPSRPEFEGLYLRWADLASRQRKRSTVLTFSAASSTAPRSASRPTLLPGRCSATTP